MYCYLSHHDQASLPTGRYTFVVPLGDARDAIVNTVLTSVPVAPPEQLVIEIEGI